MSGDASEKAQEGVLPGDLALSRVNYYHEAILQSALDGFCCSDFEGRLIEVNEAYCRMSGYKKAELLEMRIPDLEALETPSQTAARIQQLLTLGHSRFTTQHRRKDGSLFDVEVSLQYQPKAGAIIFGFLRDITELKQEERERQLMVELLRQINLGSSQDAHSMMRTVTLILREWSSCDAVGIRLKEDEDFPYYETRGLPADFVHAENKLCSVDAQGQLLRDPQGNPVLECMCGNVLCGRVSASQPFFTVKGSFWTNSTTELLGNTTTADRQARTRNRCHGEGYESVALIPLRLGQDTYGLLQLNDRRPGRFTPGKMALLENLADSLALALAQCQARQTLQESEERYRSLFDCSLDAVLVTVQNGHILHANAAACRLFGYTEEELIQIGRNGVVNRSDPRLAQALEEQSRAGRVQCELDFVRKDGTHLTGEVSSAVFTDARGLQCNSIVIRDITERKRADAQLREQAYFLEESQRVGRIGSYTLDVQAGTWDSSEMLDELFGIEPEVEKTVESWNSMVHPEDRAAMLDYFHRQVIGARQPFDREYRVIRRRDGQVCWLWGRGELAFDSQGKPLRMIGTIQDITLRKQAEQALRESQQRLEMAASSAELGIWDWDVTTDQLRWDDRMFRLYGITDIPAHYGVEIWKKALHPEDKSKTWEACQAALRGERDYDVEFRIVHPNGAVRYLQGKGLVVRDPQGKATRMLGINSDITERKHLEERLRQAQKMQAIGQLAGGVAHDFNNILASTLLHLALLQQNPKLDSETRQCLDELIKDSQRAANLTRQLLLFSRRSAMDRKTLDLNELVANLLKMLRRVIGEHINLCFNSKEGLPLVEADSGMLEQVLMNLCVNARDAISKSGGTITMGLDTFKADQERVRPYSGVKPGQFVCLSVTDSGCGMDGATLQRVFEPFFTTKEVGKGTGLGLATVHGIAGQHGGWVEVESQVSKGSTFRVFLPAGRTKAARPADPQTTGLFRGNESILLVEDENGLRRVVARSLRMLGYAVFEAANGQDALRVWNEQQGDFHLLLSDMVMPGGISGLDLAERLQKIKPTLRVIICTGYSAEMVTQEFPPEKRLVRLQKPYPLETLSKTVRTCLDQD